MYMVEWKHYIWKSKLWILIPLFIICKFTSMYFETVYVDTHIVGNDDYQAFFQEYKGMLSLEKITQIGETDEVLGRYVSYANANPAKHYIVNEVGWDAWIGNEKLDLILLVFVLFFSVYLVTNDYETGVYAVKHTSSYRKEKLCLSQQVLFIVYSLLLMVLSFLCEWIFYGVRYGLSGYGFPVQSLWTFENSSFHFSIWQCCICIHIVKGIGILLVGVLSFLAGKYIKKLWLSFFVGIAIPMIPYMLFNREQVRYFIQPLGLILGNGYFRGGGETIMYDGVLIGGVPLKNTSRMFLLGVLGAVMLCFALLFIAIFWNSDTKKCVGIKKSKYGYLFTLAEVVLVTAFCCVLVSASQKPASKMNGTYYQGQAYADEEKLYMLDEELRLVEYDSIQDKSEFIIRDVFSEKTCDGYYVDSNYIYYYVKNNVGEVSVYRTDKTDFSSELIYQEVIGDREFLYSTKYLGLINVHNYDNSSDEEWMEENIHDFWVDGNYIFMISGNSITLTDYVTKDKISLVEEGYSGGEVAYHAGTLYYFDSENNVVAMNVITRRSDYLDIPKCRTLAVSGDRLYFITEDEKVGLYYDGECQMVEGVESTPTSSIVSNDKYAFCISKENKVICIDSTNMASHEVKCYDKSDNAVNGLIYNVSVYDGKKMSLLVGEDEEVDEVLCDYNIEEGAE